MCSITGQSLLSAHTYWLLSKHQFLSTISDVVGGVGLPVPELSEDELPSSAAETKLLLQVTYQGLCRQLQLGRDSSRAGNMHGVGVAAAVRSGTEKFFQGGQRIRNVRNLEPWKRWVWGKTIKSIMGVG